MMTTMATPMTTTPDNLSILLDAAQLQEGVVRLAAAIDRDCAGIGLTLVCILKGAAMFSSDLMRAMQTEVVRIEYLRASSYGGGTASSGLVEIASSTLRPSNITGRHILIVDDIADTGHTCVAVKKHIAAMSPASMRYCTLLDKPDRREAPVEYDYVGFTIANDFVVGYGMDLDEQYRALPAVYRFTAEPPAAE